ncbi:hypothetical protein AB9K26_00805 [Psychroserpens sp. XS_ASV72]|uniref:hypothetical protein n=1 Tax=Psychroserpens sp. XS_ASV72 TaxID=3241293 RepID=UPI0035111A77
MEKSNYPNLDNPSEVAEKFANKLLGKGYNLDFSISSLEKEIDLILENELHKSSTNKEILEAELTAYFGETICRIFDAEWNGKYSGANGINFYLCKIKKGKFEFWPSHFFGYYLNNGKEDTGTFKDYLQFSYYFKGNKKFTEDGLLKKIEKA